MMQSEINIAVADKVPSLYFSELLKQCSPGEVIYGAITDKMYWSPTLPCIVYRRVWNTET